jgi:hypothetical protein
MRLILTLLLLLQLDPVLGAALCFEREQAASAECPMPDEAPAAERAFAPAGADAHGGCAVAQLCAQPAPVVVQTDPVFQIVPIVDRTVIGLESTTLPRGAHTTLFHPPRV